MSDSFSKKLAGFIDKMDEKVLQAKLNSALEMLKNNDTEELANKINKIDKKELLEKLNEFDKEKIKDLNLNVEDIKKNISNTDFEKLKMLLGENGEEIINKIKDMIQ